MVRSMAEWAKHPQAAAIASLPLLEIVKIGDAPPEKLPARRPAALRHPGARSDPRPGRADLRPHPGRARRRRIEDHRRAPAEYRLSGIRYRARQIVGPTRSAPAEGPRNAERAGARGRRVHTRLPPRHARQSRPVARGTRAAAPRPRLCLAVRVQPYRAVGVAPRLRYGRAEGQRHHDAPGRAVPRRRGARPAILSGIGDRLPDRLSDGVRRDGGAGAPRPRGRQLAGAHLAGADRALAGGPRRGAGSRAEGRAEGVHRRTSWRAGRSRARPRSAGSTICGRPCSSPRRRPAGRAPRCRSATTNRSGRRGPDARPAARDTDHPA